MDERLLVKLGLDWLHPRMTRAEAVSYGEQHMPEDIKAAGGTVMVTRSSTHGGDWYRIEFIGA